MVWYAAGICSSLEMSLFGHQGKMVWPSGEKKGVPSAGEFEAIADCWRGGVKILNDSWLTVALGGVSGRCGSDDACWLVSLW